MYCRLSFLLRCWVFTRHCLELQDCGNNMVLSWDPNSPYLKSYLAVANDVLWQKHVDWVHQMPYAGRRSEQHRLHLMLLLLPRIPLFPVCTLPNLELSLAPGRPGHY